MTYRILIADDHAVVRDGLKRILLQEGFEISAEASDGREAVDMACQSHPDVALLDIAMPLLNGIDAAREIRVPCPRTRTILLTMHKETNYIIEAFAPALRVTRSRRRRHRIWSMPFIPPLVERSI